MDITGNLTKCPTCSETMFPTKKWKTKVRYKCTCGHYEDIPIDRSLSWNKDEFGKNELENPDILNENL